MRLRPAAHGAARRSQARARAAVGVLVTLALAALAPAPAVAASSRAELQALLRDLLAWWPGEYDTMPQVELERQYGGPPEGVREHEYRVFRRIDAPQLGDDVIYGELRRGGIDGPVVRDQQLLYIVDIDERRQAVRISSRRIRDADNYERLWQRPERQRSVAIDPNYGGQCEIRFRRYGRELRGSLVNVTGPEGTACTLVSKASGQAIAWEADWVITPEEVWIFDNGYLREPARDGEPERPAGREDRVPERFYKARRFECSVQPHHRKGRPIRDAVVHDRGGQVDLARAGSAGHVLRLLRLPQPAPAPDYFKDRLTLSVFEGERSIAHTSASGDAHAIALHWPGGSASCRRL
ncbi:MAG: CpcT/CpeT family chromophore lyase, partial [Steroidobacteraceae bacterium]